MVAGYIPDMAHGRVAVPAWYSGEPVSHWLGGLAFSIRKKSGMPISTYRCESCGYLESFAWLPKEK